MHRWKGAGGEAWRQLVFRWRSAVFPDTKMPVDTMENVLLRTASYFKRTGLVAVLYLLFSGTPSHWQRPLARISPSSPFEFACNIQIDPDLLSLSLSLSICFPLYFSLSSVSRLFWRENALTRTTRSAKDFEICCKPRWWIRSRTIPSSFEGNNGQWKGNSKNLKKRLDGERQGSTVEDNRGFEVEFDS